MKSICFTSFLLASSSALFEGANGYVEVSPTPERRLRSVDEVCEELKDEITEEAVSATCECTEATDAVVLTCSVSSACISSNGADPMQGDYTMTLTKETDGTTYSQKFTTETCFQYPPGANNGEKVCHSRDADGLGPYNTCYVEVGDGNACTVCRYCPVNVLTFDCSNVGYEDRTACASNATDASILQFLYEAEFVEGCDTNGGDDDGAGNVGRTAIMSLLMGGMASVLGFL